MKIKTTLLTLVASTTLALAFTTTVNASTTEPATSNEQSEFVKAYNEGRAKGILNDKNMTKKEFLDLCKKSVFPAYLNYIKDNQSNYFFYTIHCRRQL